MQDAGCRTRDAGCGTRDAETRDEGRVTGDGRKLCVMSYEGSAMSGGGDAETATDFVYEGRGDLDIPT